MRDSSLLKFPKGKLIIRENEVDAHAYFIESGSVEVFRGEGAQKQVIGRLGKGQFFGEMGLILEKPRTANVAAAEDTVVRKIGQDTFQRFLQRQPDKVLPLLKIFFERFRLPEGDRAELVGRLSSAIAAPTPHKARLKAPAPAVAIDEGVLVKGLTPESEDALASMGAVRRIIDFPFRVGRAVVRGGEDLFWLNDLAIPDHKPLQVSRNHCSIDRDADGFYFVEDRGSTLGSIVNGAGVGGPHPEQRAKLKPGRNELILGEAHSRFRFELRVG
jgi:CRP-like cAMP-binding protein